MKELSKYLQCVLNSVWEVLQSAQRDGVSGARLAWSVRLSQMRHHHQSMTFASQSSPLQHRLLVLNAALIEINP